MKICVKYLRNDSYKMRYIFDHAHWWGRNWIILIEEVIWKTSIEKRIIFTMPIDEVIIGFMFV